MGGTSFSKGIKTAPESADLDSLNFLAAYSWYKTTDKRYKSGIQLTFARFGIDAGKTRESILFPQRDLVMFNLIPFNVGYASYLTINDVLGMEFNFNLGFGMTMKKDFVQLGIHSNPNVKFRYKNLAFGLDASFLHGPNLTGNSDLYSKNTFSATFGANF